MKYVNCLLSGIVFVLFLVAASGSDDGGSSSGAYQKMETDEYKQSVARQIKLEEAGLEEEAKMEEKARQKWLKEK